MIKTLRPRQNGRHFADDIMKCILLNENLRFDYSFTEIPIVQMTISPSIISSNGLAPMRQQGIL